MVMKDLIIFLLFIAMIFIPDKWVIVNSFFCFIFYIDVFIGPKWVLELVWGSF